MNTWLRVSFGFIFILSVFFGMNNNVLAEEDGTIINHNGVKIKPDEFNRLKDLGFTDEAINFMPKDIFKENKDIEVQSKSETTQYQEIQENPFGGSLLSADEDSNYLLTELTEEEYFKRVNASKKESESVSPLASDSTATSYRRLTTSISRLTKTSARLQSSFKWDTMPKTRSIDLLTTSIDSTFEPVSGTNYGQQFFSYFEGAWDTPRDDSAIYRSSSSAWSKKSAGYGVKMNLKNSSSSIRVHALSGYAYYNIRRANSIVPRSINAYGNYAHAKKTVSAGFSYGLSFGGPSISFAPTVSKSFDKITTHAQLKY